MASSRKPTRLTGSDAGLHAMNHTVLCEMCGVHGRVKKERFCVKCKKSVIAKVRRDNPIDIPQSLYLGFGSNKGRSDCRPIDQSPIEDDYGEESFP